MIKVIINNKIYRNKEYIYNNVNVKRKNIIMTY